MIDEVYTAQKVEQSSGALVGVTETGLPDQGRLVYGTVELQHPQSHSILSMTFDINN